MRNLAESFGAGKDVFAPKITYRKEKVKGKVRKRKIIEQLKKEDFITQEWQMFIRYLPGTITVDKLELLDKYFSFNNTQNAEIALDWFSLCIKSGYDEILPYVERFLKKVGRRKFVLPIYELLNEQSKYKNFAKSVFSSQKLFYHAVTRNSVEKLLQN